MGCSQPTIRNLVQRHTATGSVDDRPRPGRERVTTPQQDRYIQLQHLRDHFRPASRTARETPGRNNPRISSPTVRRRLRDINLQAR
ncbi:Transposable element Tc1 transposase [Clarias magur]|uniref:Transposable element Tc1 transposase n=1 Tax=Clarias magur TaxID=1594786 RepID=A0A8J4U954_CLAMG|nr:Transposable element Tc1 transposase [Clarias magur]